MMRLARCVNPLHPSESQWTGLSSFAPCAGGALLALSLLVLTLFAPEARAACQVNCPSCINKAEGFPMRLPWATRDAITLPRAYGSGWHCATDFYSLDFYLLAGTPVYPVAPGRVFQKGTLGSYGNYVMLDHQNGYQSLYAHLKDPVPLALNVLVGTQTVIGSVGKTGTDEVHLERLYAQRLAPLQWPDELEHGDEDVGL